MFRGLSSAKYPFVLHEHHHGFFLFFDGIAGPIEWQDHHMKQTVLINRRDFVYRALMTPSFFRKSQHRIRGGTILAAGGEQNGIPPLCSWTVGEEPCRETSTQWWVVWSIGRQIWLSVELSNMSSHNFALVGCRALPIIGTHSWSPTMFSQFPIFILSYIRN